MRQVSFTSLRFFVSVCEEGSIAKAAERESIVPSAVSKRLSDLEATMGVTLLNRFHQGVSPTAAGEALLFHARSVLNNLVCMKNAMSTYAEGVQGHIRMFTNSSALSEFLPEDLRSFKFQNPKVKIELEEHLSVDILRALRDGRIDIGIVSTREESADLSFFSYREDRLVVVVRPEHPLAAYQRVDYAETLAYDQVELGKNSALSCLLEKASQAAGIRRKMRIHVGGFDAVCRMVNVEMGAGVVPLEVAKLYTSAMRLKTVELNDAWACRQLYVAVRDGDALFGATRVLLSHLTHGSWEACVKHNVQQDKQPKLHAMYS